MIYTTGWTREKLQTERDYTAWLSSLKDGETVVQQQFTPPQNFLGMPFERWRFVKGHITGVSTDSWRFHHAPDTSPVRPDGIACWWGNDREWGEVFPARLVPMHYDLRLDDGRSGHCVYGHDPVYEPEFFGCFRHTFFVKHGKDFHSHCQSIRDAHPRNYQIGAENGVIIVAFSPSDEPQIIDGTQFCFSQYLKQ